MIKSNLLYVSIPLGGVELIEIIIDLALLIKFSEGYH